MGIHGAFPLQKPTRVVIAGDWHGDTHHGIAVINWAKTMGADGILHLGDFGIWAGGGGRAYLHGLNRALNAAGMWLGFVDGNHENFDWLEALPVRGGLRPVTQRITHLPRGYRWTWGERTWLALGGAVSMDRKWRKPCINWWPQEEITWSQAQSTIEAGPVDYMLTHDAPLNVDVPGLSDDVWPEDALKSAAAHRALLQTVVEEARPSHLFHGHMHVRYRGDLEYQGGICVVEGLGDNNGPFHENVEIVDLDVRGNIILPR